MEGGGRRKKSIVNVLGTQVDAQTKDRIVTTVAVSMGGVKSGTVCVEPTAVPGPNDEELRNIAALDVVLREPIMRGGFRTFLERNYCAENLLCWKEIEEFKSLTDQGSIRVCVAPPAAWALRRRFRRPRAGAAGGPRLSTHSD